MNARARDRLSGVRVLVVEDVAAVRQVIRWMLEAEGATVVEACTGREALDLAGTQTFDVVLTDLGLPDMSGEAVITGIRSASQGRTPVGVVSGAHATALAHALEVGAERAFTKPVNRHALIRYLEDKRKVAVTGNAPARNTETNMTVLIIEDDCDMCALLRDVLERAGHRVIGRPDGIDLPALAELERFDAVIVDKELPGPNGLDLLSYLRKRLPALPVIFVTAFGGPGVAKEAARRGAYRYLEKPFSVAAILDTLAAVSMHRLRGEPGPQA